MKKLLAIAISLSLVCSFSTVVLAENTTVLTTTVPDATYTLNIPADQEIPFGATRTEIGNVTVADAAGFAREKNLQVTLTYEPFKADGASTVIPYKVNALHDDALPGDTVSEISTIMFFGQENGGVSTAFNDNTGWIKSLFVDIQSEDWGKALAGEYSSTITFTAEVVVSEP